jgi:hypothetical protein
MATVTATYAPAAGRQAVTLTSWAGSAAFATTPTAGSQIEGANALTIGVDGVITGPDGTYAIHHITTAGVIEADSFAIATADTTAPIISALTAAGTDPDSIAVSVNTNEDNGGVYYFASGNATEDKPTIRAGAQGITTVTQTGDQPLTLTLATGSYYVHAMHEDDAGNQSNVLSSTEIVLAEIEVESETGTGTATYAPPADMTLTIVQEPVDEYLTDGWSSPPETGEQALTFTAEGAFDPQLNWSAPAEGTFDYYYINNDGNFYQRTITTGSLQSLPDENVVIESVEVTRTTITVEFSYSGVDAESFEARLDEGTWATTSSPATFTALTSATEYVVAIRPVNENGTPGIATTRTVTTSPAVDITPSEFSFPALTGVARSAAQVSSPVTIQGVDAATNVPITVTGGQYSISTDGGETYGAQASTATNGRLNHRIRLHHESSDEFSSGGYNGVRTTTITVGGVVRSFITTTLADTVGPVITLTSGNSTPVLGSTFQDPGYSATDNADGDFDVEDIQIIGTLDNSILTPQQRIYRATDRSGNVSEAQRTVTFINPDAAPVDPLISSNRFSMSI